MSSKIKREVRFYNSAHYPLQSLAILHYYNKTEPKKNSTLYLYVSTPNEDDFPDKRTGTIEGINYELYYLKDKYLTSGPLIINIDRYDFDKYDKDYWMIAWHNEHDKGFYYLTTHTSPIDKIKDDLLDALDKAIGDAIDICTESDTGTLLSKVGNYAIAAMANADDNSPKIEKCFKEDNDDTIDIELRANRKMENGARIQITSHDDDTNFNICGYTYEDH